MAASEDYGEYAAIMDLKLGVKLVGWLGVALLVLEGCTGVPTLSERRSRSHFKVLTQAYRPGEQRARLPQLDNHATLEAFLTYAMLNQPRVAEAYYDYAASLERITIERSLPDPRLTLEMDITDAVMAIMPGLMTELPPMKKLRLRAEVASAESESKYFAFQTALLQTAFAVKRAYYQIHFAEGRLQVYRETLELLGQLEELARAQVAVGRGTVQNTFRARMEQDRLRTEIINGEDARRVLLVQLKAAMGLRKDDPDPPVPTKFELTPVEPSSTDLPAEALALNPRLKAMEADVRAAERGIALARTSRQPEFSMGVEANVKASPVMARPAVGVTLPIWRDKIAAEIEAAQARKSAVEARLSAEQIQLAVDYADKAFSYREATRALRLLRGTLLPLARQALETARIGYSSGGTEFSGLLEAERSLLDLRLAEVEASTQRELALAEISLLIVGTPPPGTPGIEREVALEP